ncbi:MAG: hypothetical protein SOZ34_06285 [Clostridia bacterium]|nr:hypothetical protein [Clostridia bacterium]
MEIRDKWISGCKVNIFPWIDGKRIYCNIAYYKSGTSIFNPAWEKTVFITDDENGRNLVYKFTATLVDYVCRMNIPNGKEVTITVDDVPGLSA